MQNKSSERVSGNAVEFGEGSIASNPGQLPMMAGTQLDGGVRRYKMRRVYQLGVSVPDARRNREDESDCNGSQPNCK
jgi:hypothetical protein